MKTNIIALGGITIISASIVASAAIFGIQSVAADATSTAPVDTESIEPEPIEEPAEGGEESAEMPGDDTSASTSTPSETATPAEAPAPELSADTTTEAASTTDTGTTATQTAEVTAAKPDKAEVMADVSGLEDAYYQETGSYLQILRGNGLPTYETGTVAQKLGKNVADDVWVHVYEAPGGKGYQVFYEQDGVLQSVGYGPEAAERTFSRTIVAAPSATSTPATAL